MPGPGIPPNRDPRVVHRGAFWPWGGVGNLVNILKMPEIVWNFLFRWWFKIKQNKFNLAVAFWNHSGLVFLHSPKMPQNLCPDMTCSHIQPPGQEFQWLEFFAGVANCTLYMRRAGFVSGKFDILYCDKTKQGQRKSNWHDLLSPSGFALLRCWWVGL